MPTHTNTAYVLEPDVDQQNKKTAVGKKDSNRQLESASFLLRGGKRSRGGRATTQDIPLIFSAQKLAATNSSACLELKKKQARSARGYTGEKELL